MNCLEFLDRLGDLAAGAGSAADREAAARHAAGCPECGELWRAVRSGRWPSFEPDTEEGAEDLVAAVLERTAGPACGRAEALLCDYVDGELPPEEQALVGAHLEHCPGCANLALALRQAMAALPLLAEMEPDPAFAIDVIRATSRRQPIAAQDPVDVVVSAVAAWWRRMLARPRFAFEVAYVATLLLLLAVGNPASTLHAASTGFERVRTGWSSAVSDLVVSPAVKRTVAQAGAVVQGLHGRADAGEGLWSRVGDRLVSAWSWLRGMMSSLVDVMAEGWGRVRVAAAQWLSQRGAEPGRGAARSRE